MAAYEIIEQEKPFVSICVRRYDDGRTWACCAHGPGHGRCDLCREVDDVLMGMLASVKEGKVSARQREDGEFEFTLTAQGKVAVEELISTKPEMVEFWAQLQADPPWDDESGGES